MSWLTDWFRRDKTQMFIKLITKIALVMLGRVGDDIFNIVRECVIHAEQAGGAGETKWKNAMNCIKKKIGEPTGVAKYLIKIFIEAAVIEIKKNKGILIL